MRKNCDILGVNTGRLGFIADITPEEIKECISDLYSHTYRIDERSVIEVQTEGNASSLQGYPFALNEVAVLKRDNSSMISIRVEVDGEFLATYQADGLIINTPTGSTGYALSVGGPIIVPQSGTFCITPVASHSLNARPITLRDQVELTLTVESRNTTSSLPSTDVAKRVWTLRSSSCAVRPAILKSYNAKIILFTPHYAKN